MRSMFQSDWTKVVIVDSVVLATLVLTFKLSWTQAYTAYTGLLIAMASGLLGAAFSMLIQANNRSATGTLEELNSASGWPTLIVRGSVGLGGAAILYFFFDTGLLGGSIWPDLQKIGFNEIALVLDNTEVPSRLPVPNKDLCLIVVWCFLAGFSENLVPSILQKTENRVTTT